jgi:hypothetical protein
MRLLIGSTQMLNELKCPALVSGLWNGHIKDPRVPFSAHFDPGASVKDDSPSAFAVRGSRHFGPAMLLQIILESQASASLASNLRHQQRERAFGDDRDVEVRVRRMPLLDSAAERGGTAAMKEHGLGR